MKAIAPNLSGLYNDDDRIAFIKRAKLQETLHAVIQKHVSYLMPKWAPLVPIRISEDGGGGGGGWEGLRELKLRLKKKRNKQECLCGEHKDGRIAWC